MTFQTGTTTTTRSRFRAARMAVATVVGAAAALGVLGTGLLGMGQASAATSSAAPPAFQIPVAIALTDGSATIGSRISATGITGVSTGTLGIEGSIENPLAIDVPQSDVQIQPNTARLSLGPLGIGLPATFTATSALTGTAQLQSNGSITSTISASLETTAQVGPFSCTIGPIAAQLTTGTSGDLTGTPITGPLGGVQSGVLVADDFSVPAVQPSATCPGLVAVLTNALAGLPLAPGASSLRFDTTIVNGLSGGTDTLYTVPTTGTAGTNAAVIGLYWTTPSSDAALAFTSGSPASTGTARVDSRGSLGGFITVSGTDSDGSNPIVATDGAARGTAPFTVTGNAPAGGNLFGSWW